MNTDKLTAVIIDDEQLAIDTLMWQINEFCYNIKILDTFTNPKKAFTYIKENKIDLCFLDIDMPEISGFDFIKMFPDINFDIIFTTAYSEYAIKAFKVSAFDYLLKPIDEEELINTIHKYKKANEKVNTSQQLNILINQLIHPNRFPDRIAIPTIDGINMIDINNIIRLEANNNYTKIHLVKNQSILISKTLKETESTLDPNRFIRIHQSHTIDIHKVETYEKGSGGNVKLKNGDRIPISRKNKEAFLNKLLNR